jgi:hypothetical protein
MQLAQLPGRNFRRRAHTYRLKKRTTGGQPNVLHMNKRKNKTVRGGKHVDAA